MSTPDRFTKLVDKTIPNVLFLGNESVRSVDISAWKKEFAKLLRAQHRAVVRKVKALRDTYGLPHSAGYKMACDDLLAWLKGRA